MELSQFDIQYQPRTSIKGQTLSDFVAEFIEPVVVEQNVEPAIRHEGPKWKLFVDTSSNEHNSGAGIILISPEEHKFHSVVRFGFSSSNNEAEYEAFLAGLRPARSISH